MTLKLSSECSLWEKSHCGALRTDAQPEGTANVQAFGKTWLRCSRNSRKATEGEGEDIRSESSRSTCIAFEAGEEFAYYSEHVGNLGVC